MIPPPRLAVAAAPPARAEAPQRAHNTRFALAVAVLAFAIFTLMAIQLREGGTARVAAQLGLFAVVVVLRPGEAVKTLISSRLLFVFPVFAIVSAAWSIDPSVSLRYAFQLSVTMFVAVHLGRLLGPRQFIVVLFASMLAFSLLSIASGRMGASSAGPVLIGLAGSKNQMALFAQLLLASSLAIVVDRHQLPIARLASITAMPLAAYLLLGANSAGALVVAAFSTVTFLVLCLLQVTARAARTGLLALALACAFPLFAFPQEMSGFANSFSQTVLRKDATLTGRTDLWRAADELIASRPMLGYGYHAVWLDESPLGTGLRRMVNKDDGRTFHFHDTFRQVTVDTGYVGLAIFLLTTMAITIGLVRHLLVAPSAPVAFFAVVFMSTMARCFFELVIGPFKLSWVLVAVAGAFAISSAATGQGRVMNSNPTNARLRVRPNQ